MWTVGALALLAWAVVFVAIHLHLSRRKQQAINDRFINEEREANNTRKKDIDPFLFYTADFSQLPEMGEDKYTAHVLRAAKRTMIYFKEPISNVELKKTYGPMQLETIAQNEENFHDYILALIHWAQALMETGQKDEALRILEHTIGLGSEFRRSYQLAADIYAERRDLEKLESLLAAVTLHPFKDSTVQKGLVHYIANKQSEAAV